MSTAGRVRGGHGLAIAGIAIALLLAWASVARAAAPGNDDFASAQVIGPGLPLTVSGSNSEATKQAEEPDHAGNAGGHSVWFEWTPSSSGPVRLQVTSCFASLHTALVAVYTGSAINALTPVATKAMPNASNCFFSEPEQLEFSVAAGTTYRIAIDGRDGQEGSFFLTLAPPPPNDDFASAATIPVILTNVVYHRSTIDGGRFFEKSKPLRYFIEGGEYGAWAEGLEPRPEELVISKQYPSAFFGTSLASTLTALGCDSVLLTGVSTSGCVRATCVDAMSHGFRTAVIADACGDRHEAPHNANLFDMDAKYGDVVREDEVLTYLANLGKNQ